MAHTLLSDTHSAEFRASGEPLRALARIPCVTLSTQQSGADSSKRGDDRTTPGSAGLLRDAESSTARVVDEIAQTLAFSGITHVFGVGGANIEDLYDALERRSDITAVLAKHEFSAGTMADGYCRAGAPFGVVMATSGGAMLNLVPALGESFASRVPVLALVGQAPTALDGRGSFQDTSGRGGSLDAEALFEQVSVYCKRVTSADEIGPALTEAIAAARSGGPAVLLLPKDIQQSPPNPAAARRREPASPKQLAGRVDRRLIARVFDASSVTIVAGEQVSRDDARAALEQLRRTLGANIAAVPDAKDVVEHHGVHWLGVSGVMGNPSVAEAVGSSSLCLLVGTRLAATASAGLLAALDRTRTVSIGSAPPFVDSMHFHSDDLQTTLTALTDVLDHGQRPQPPRVPVSHLHPPPWSGPGIRYADAMAVLDDHLSDGVDIVVDAGNTGAAAIHHLPVRPDGRFVVALGMGGMGYSFGAGIGMAFWRSRRTVILAGDGSFFMHGMEIHTAVQYRLPVTFVLFNNNAHAMCVTREQIFYSGDYTYNRFEPSSLGAGLAAMFPTLPAVDISDIDALPGVLESAVERDGPSVISIQCSADEIPPFAPFLSSPSNTTSSQPNSHVSARRESSNVAARA